MIVCVCKRVSDGQIRDRVHEGVGSLKAISRELGVATQCGKCACHAREVVEEALAERATSSLSVGLFVPQPA